MLRSVIPSLLVLASLCPAADTVVHKTAEPAEGAAWIPGQWNTAKVASLLVDGAPAELAATSRHALAVDFTFSGKGFEYATATPAHPLTIPGAARSVSLWYKGDGKDYPLVLNLVDGWGRSEVDGKKFEWNFGSGTNGEWKQATFKVPQEWVKPIRIAGLTSHNWGAQNNAATMRVLVDQIEVDTDLAGVDPATGLPADFAPNPDPKKKDEPRPNAPLLEAGLASGQETEVFNGLTPAFVFSARNWRAGELKGTLAWTLNELADGTTATKIGGASVALSVDSLASVALPMPVPRYGLYRLDAVITWADGKTSPSAITFAALAPQPALTPAVTEASPWGLNTHGGSPIYPASFRKAGVQWFRDYAFSYDWMVKAKGADKRYAGWPWYPTIMATYEAAGAHVLPILVHSITVVDGKVGPDRTWRSEITDILNAFPQLKVWELDNEMDGLWIETARKDKALGWANYKAFHKAFGEVVAAVGGGELTAVENGQAGINTERVAEFVTSGSFKGIAVTNCHHYCGIDAPELNIANQNTGGDGDGGATQLFHDRLRSQVAASGGDGTPRKVWLTEFGWDTRAGKIVSPWQQAVYLQRGYLVALHAGIDKAFWFWGQDGEKATTFFDGCGLLDVKRQPKLAMAAMGGMTSLLPNPTVHGTLDAGPGTFGFLLRQGDQRIAALWTLEAEKGPEITVGSGKLQDYLGNPLPGRTRTLTQAPLYVVGIDADDRFARQGSWDLTSPWLVQATAGDPLTVNVTVAGDRPAAVSGEAALEVPKGWTAPAVAKLEAAPGAKQTAALAVTIPATAAPGEYVLNVPVSEGGKPLKRMAVRVLVRAALGVEVARLTGEPGATTLTVTVTNRAQRSVGGKVELGLPAGWSTPSAKVDLPALAAGERRALKLPLTWSAAWKPQEKATVAVVAADGSTTSVGIVPGALTIHRLPALKLDGDLADWPASTRVPDWVLGTTEGDVKGEVHMAWTAEGLAIGMRLADSTLLVSDPNAFWHADATEFLIDARPRGAARPQGKGDRQFWFVPQPARGGVFAGQWKRGEEIPETRLDVKEIRGASKAVGDGYAMEVLIPSALLPGLELKPGSSAAALLLIAVHGKVFYREVGWPVTKAVGTGGGPETWPVLVLAE